MVAKGWAWLQSSYGFDVVLPSSGAVESCYVPLGLWTCVSVTECFILQEIGGFRYISIHIFIYKNKE